MPLEQLVQTFLPAIEEELHQAVAQAKGPDMSLLHHMLAFHLGWEGDKAGPEARGKRIRPILLLLTTAAAGGEWRKALPAAASVELIHNFSLIHDDIEDNSPVRRGRPTLWKLWGVPQAINAGDAMFSLAHLALLKLSRYTSANTTLKASHLLLETCLNLTRGQYLDISYELRGDLTLQAYWPMVGGKTAALLATCNELGALVAEAEETVCNAYREFGLALGLAFQVLDDLLGIWGDAALTGKSAESDLLSGKKSLPVLYGLSQAGEFAARWAQGRITADEVPGLAAQLEREGAHAYTRECANDLTEQALEALERARPQGDAGEALQILTNNLLKRQV